jgi:hypothetical protein
VVAVSFDGKGRYVKTAGSDTRAPKELRL